MDLVFIAGLILSATNLPPRGIAVIDFDSQRTSMLLTRECAGRLPQFGHAKSVHG